MKLHNLLITATLLFLLSAALPLKIQAAPIAASSAGLNQSLEKTEEDNRAKILENYLKQFDSPLVGSASTFVEQADKNNLDWKLVAAIAGVESWYGNRIPPQSNNAWGYGVYGGKVRRFASWDEAIIVISSDLRVKYMEKWGATDVYSIGRIYAADPKWASKVIFFMNQIEEFEDENNRTSLPLSI